MNIYNSPPIMEDRGYRYLYNNVNYSCSYPDNEIISNYSIAVDRGLSNMTAWECAHTHPQYGEIISQNTLLLDDYLDDQQWSNLNDIYFDIYQHVPSIDVSLEELISMTLHNSNMTKWLEML